MIVIVIMIMIMIMIMIIQYSIYMIPEKNVQRFIYLEN